MEVSPTSLPQRGLSPQHHRARCQLGHRLCSHPPVNDLAQPACSESHLCLISTRLHSTAISGSSCYKNK